MLQLTSQPLLVHQIVDHLKTLGAPIPSVTVTDGFQYYLNNNIIQKVLSLQLIVSQRLISLCSSAFGEQLVWQCQNCITSASFSQLSPDYIRLYNKTDRLDSQRYWPMFWQKCESDIKDMRSLSGPVSNSLTIKCSKRGAALSCFGEHHLYYAKCNAKGQLMVVIVSKASRTCQFIHIRTPPANFQMPMVIFYLDRKDFRSIQASCSLTAPGNGHYHGPWRETFCYSGACSVHYFQSTICHEGWSGMLCMVCRSPIAKEIFFLRSFFRPSAVFLVGILQRKWVSTIFLSIKLTKEAVWTAPAGL